MRGLNPDQRRSALRLALPGIATEMVAMRRFARDHGAELRGVRGYRRFRYAQKFGIDLLPPMPLAGRVIDIGANEGQFIGALLGVAPDVSITAFEPEPGTAERLRTNFGSDPRVTIEQCALSDGAGTAQLHVTENTVFASLNRPLDSLPTMYARGADQTSTVDVAVTTLDQAVTGPVDVLKIDVQGAERQVLAGGQRALSETRTVLLEMNFVPHYEGEAGFGDLHELMLESGFRLHGLGAAQRSASRGDLLWADACYARV